MRDRTRETAAFLGLAMGTLNLSLILVPIVLALHLADDLGAVLDRLSTLAGLGVFGLLWAVFAYTAYRGLGELDLSSPAGISAEAVVQASLAWGARAGLAVFAGLFVAGIAASVVRITLEGNVENPMGLLTFAVVILGAGGVVATAVGLAIGTLSGLLDFALLALARRLAG